MGRHRKFERLDGTGLTEEWVDDMGHTVAYLDRYHRSPLTVVTVFKPETGGSTCYMARELEKGKAIIERHISKQVYTPDPEDD